MDIAPLEPDAALEIEFAQVRISFGADEIGLRKWQAGLDHQRRQPIAVRVESGARAVDNRHAFAFPLRQMLERRPSLAHRKDHRHSGARSIGFPECHEIDREGALAQAVRNLVEQERIVRLMAAGRVLLLAA